jgi:F-type H+-transporting ATPase subunit a
MKMPMFTYFKKMYFSNIILGFLFCLTSLTVWANEKEVAEKPASAEVAMTQAEAPEESKSDKFDPGKLIMHHIADEHEWHFMTIGHTHITLPLPCIVYSESKGLSVFSSANFKK